MFVSFSRPSRREPEVEEDSSDFSLQILQSMVMDQTDLNGVYGTSDGLKLRDETFSELLDPSPVGYGFKANVTSLGQENAKVHILGHDLIDFSHGDNSLLLPNPIPNHSVLSSGLKADGDFHEDLDFSDVVLNFISDILMEEDLEEKACMFQESTALQAAERSLYELLENPPPSSDCTRAPSSDQFSESADDNKGLTYTTDEFISSNTSSGKVINPVSDLDAGDRIGHDSCSPSTSQSSNSSSSGGGSHGFLDLQASSLRVPEILSDSESLMQIKRGFEEAIKFIPNGSSLTIDLESNGLLKGLKAAAVTGETKLETDCFIDGTRLKKNLHPRNLELDREGSNKQSLVYTESTLSSEMLDMILLGHGKGEAELREALQKGKTKNEQKNGQSKGASSGKNRGKKQGGKKGVVDLRTLLTVCAQAVAANDHRGANDLLKQIRQHASPTGDGMQRMAHYFANGLEARLAASGNEIYRRLMAKSTSTADILKAYHLFLAACPFRKVTNFFANKTIMNAAEKANRIHIVDFGILYGVQWPCLIQRLSHRPGGPPKVRITGIDFPQPGFRPAERIEETGRRLRNYAEKFNVPFEFNAIAQKWETIQIEDLKLDKDDVLVVTSIFRLRNLLDETVLAECPKDIVLNLIRRMNPDVFIPGIVNGAYSAPFFISRFREALFHFSTLFDMLETIVPPDTPERMLVEKDIFGWEAMNVIACEGVERIERPETYKQWQVRNLRAGLKQLPLNREIMDLVKDRVEKQYHRDYVFYEDSQWLLMGWKGRVAFALSSWKPAY